MHGFTCTICKAPMAVRERGAGLLAAVHVGIGLITGAIIAILEFPLGLVALPLSAAAAWAIMRTRRDILECVGCGYRIDRRDHIPPRSPLPLPPRPRISERVKGASPPPDREFINLRQNQV